MKQKVDSNYNETSVEDCFVLIPKSRVTPRFEVIDFISHEYFDGFSQLFFEQESVKTHFGEHSFDIIQHGKSAYSLIENEFIISRE